MKTKFVFGFCVGALLLFVLAGMIALFVCQANNTPSTAKESLSFAVAELLVSDDQQSKEIGGQILRENRDVILKSLISGLCSENREKIGTAAYELGIIFCPWRRSKDASTRFIQFTNLRCVSRPVTRVSSIPEAKQLQQILLRTIHQMRVAARKNDVDSYNYTEVIKQLLSTLDEFADDGVIDKLLLELSEIKQPNLAEGFINVFDHYCGVPPIYQSDALCGNSSEAEFKAFAAEESQRLEKAKIIIADTWKEVRVMSSDARIKRAIATWRSTIVPQMQQYSGHYIHAGFISDNLAPLIRFGTPAVDLLRTQQKQEDDLGVKAIWECVIAAITGSEDKELVRKLFTGSDDHLELACQVVEASGSTDWLKELSALQTRNGFDGGKASQVIAGRWRERGIPELERAVAFSIGNYHARCSIDEIKARQKDGSPKRPGWIRFP